MDFFKARSFSNGKLAFILALALDRATKCWALSSLAQYRGERAFVSLGLHFNRGISFSLLENSAHLGLTVTLAAAGLLGLLCASCGKIRSMPGMPFLWAGALGNLTDRLLYGCVVDWLRISGVCVNLADVWLCIGDLAVFVRCARNFKQKEQ
ncbi:MAG: signal peptidase II [Synergistaceae bacterium]|nr:signal peptidase II [Synergistaceae bacterium]